MGAVLVPDGCWIVLDGAGASTIWLLRSCSHLTPLVLTFDTAHTCTLASLLRGTYTTWYCFRRGCCHSEWIGPELNWTVPLFVHPFSYPFKGDVRKYWKTITKRSCNEELPFCFGCIGSLSVQSFFWHVVACLGNVSICFKVAGSIMAPHMRQQVKCFHFLCLLVFPLHYYLSVNNNTTFLRIQEII